MALPLVVGDTNTEVAVRQWHAGPYISSAGAVYGAFSQFDSADTDHENVLAIMKSTDPDIVSFSEQDRAGAPRYHGNATKIRPRTYWAEQVGDIIHVAYWDDLTTFGSVGYRYITFDTTIDEWSTITTIEGITGAGPLTQSVCIKVRDDGDVIALYNGHTEKIKGVDYERVHYARKENGGFATAGVQVSGGGQADWTGSIIVKGSSDRMHFFFKDNDALDGYQRTLNSANSLESLPAAGDSEIHVAAHLFGQGVNNNGEIRCPYHDGPPNANEGKISYAEFTSSDTPGAFTVNADVGDFVARAGNPSKKCMALDEGDEHLLYSRNSDNDLWHDVNDGADVEEIVANVQGVSCTVYERNSRRVIGVFYDDGGVPTYDEILLTENPVLARGLQRPHPHSIPVGV